MRASRLMAICFEPYQCRLAAVVIFAWIVWVESIGPDTIKPQWSFFKAVDTLSECKTEALNAAALFGKALEALGDKVKVSEDTVVAHREGTAGAKSWSLITTYKCLPDTVDPRGTGGK